MGGCSTEWKAAIDVKETLQVDVDTGEAIIVAVDDRLLQLPKTE